MKQGWLQEKKAPVKEHSMLVLNTKILVLHKTTQSAKEARSGAVSARETTTMRASVGGNRRRKIQRRITEVTRSVTIVAS